MAEIRTIEDASDFQRQIELVCQRDSQLAASVADLGMPKWWRRAPGFATLLRIILEQQVSLASGAAVYRKLVDACEGNVTAGRVHALGDARLRAIGFSRQKAHYAALLASAVVSRTLHLGQLSRKPDDEARAILMSRKGVGEWTANVYLMNALGRSDILPIGDLGLVEGIRRMFDLKERPTPDQLLDRAERWRPYRSLAVQIIWQHYLRIE
jgi:DNA-3-methyladenine glycosylase II